MVTLENLFNAKKILFINENDLLIFEDKLNLSTSPSKLNSPESIISDRAGKIGKWEKSLKEREILIILQKTST